jgi:hypothetical protein
LPLEKNEEEHAHSKKQYTSSTTRSLLMILWSLFWKPQTKRILSFWRDYQIIPGQHEGGEEREEGGGQLDSDLQEAILLEKLLMTGFEFIQKVLHLSGHSVTLLGDFIGRTNSWPLRKLGFLLTPSRLPSSSSPSSSPRQSSLNIVNFFISNLLIGLSEICLLLSEWIQFASSRVSLALANSMWQLEMIPKSFQRTILFLLQQRGVSTLSLPSQRTKQSQPTSIFPNLTDLSFLVNQSRSVRSFSETRRPHLPSIAFRKRHHPSSSLSSPALLLQPFI